MPTDLWRLSAIDLATKIRSKDVSAREVIDAHLDRIDAVNGALNAVTVVLADEAREAADTADAALAAGDEVGPLHGVPMTIKENVDLAGSPTTNGIAAFADAVPLKDAPSIAHLKNAGAIPIGRTNLPDFGMRWHTDNDLRGPTLNPWDSTRTPGGSSGGDAAALAAGMTPLGNGNDLGGSLRWPSRCCGTTAIRPTQGRVPSASDLAPTAAPQAVQLMAVQGPMARTVADLRLALSIMSQPDPRDPGWIPAPLQGRSNGPIRVAVTETAGGDNVDDATAESVRSAAAALSDAGYVVEAAEPPEMADLVENWTDLVWHETKRVFLPLMEGVASQDAMHFLHLAIGNANALDELSYMRALSRRTELAKAWSLFQAQQPLILGPVYQTQPFKVGVDVAGSDEAAKHVNDIRLTLAANVLGLPSVALPTGTAAIDGREFPQGVQIIGPRYREDLCLDAAEAVEQRLGTLAPIDPRP